MTRCIILDSQLTTDLTNTCWMTNLRRSYEAITIPWGITNSWEEGCFSRDLRGWWHARHKEHYNSLAEGAAIPASPNVLTVEGPYFAVWYLFCQHKKIFTEFWYVIPVTLYFLASDALRRKQQKTQFKNSKNISKKLPLKIDRYQLNYWKILFMLIQ